MSNYLFMKFHFLAEVFGRQGDNVPISIMQVSLDRKEKKQNKKKKEKKKSLLLRKQSYLN